MRRIERTIFCIASAAMLAPFSIGQTPAPFPSEPRSAEIQQIAPAPSRANRAATPADEASVAPQPAARDLGKVNQLPSGVRASGDAADITLGATADRTPDACSAGSNVGDVASHLPPEAAGALDACTTLVWLENERARREREAATDIAAALAEEGKQQEAGKRPARPPQK